MTRLDEVERKVAALEMFARPRDHEARIAWLEDVTRTVNEALGRAPASIHPPYMSALDAAEIYDSHVNKRTAGEPPAPSEPSGIPDFLKRLGLPHDERAVKVFLHGDWARDPDPLEPNYYMEDAALRAELEATRKERAKPKDCNCRALVEHWMGHWRDTAHRAERDRDAAKEERDRLVEEIEPLRETVSRGILGHDFAEIEGGTAALRAGLEATGKKLERRTSEWNAACDLYSKERDKTAALEKELEARAGGQSAHRCWETRAKLTALVEAAEALPWGSGSDRRAVRVGRGLVIAPEWGTLRDATDEAKQ